MPQYLAEQEIKLWGWSTTLSDEQNVKILLGKMAICRQASKLDEVTLGIYTQTLINLDLRAFQVAMARISNTRPQQGETLFPSLGYILEEMEEARERFPVFSKDAKEINTIPVFADPAQKRLTK